MLIWLLVTSGLQHCLHNLATALLNRAWATSISFLPCFLLFLNKLKMRSKIVFSLTVWRLCLHDAIDELLQVPVALGLQLVDFLELDHGVGVNELCEAHESSANADD